MKKPDRATDELDYLASEGFRLADIGTNDAEELRLQMRARFLRGGAWQFSLNCLVTLAVISASLYMALSPAPVYPFTGSVEKTMATNRGPVGKPPEASGNKSRMPVPDPVIVSVPYSPPAVHAPAEAPVADVSHEPLARKEIPLDSVHSPGQRELRYSLNSPVRYIRDLKVTDYTQLYFRRMNARLPGGLEATYSEDQRDYELRGRESYLHEALDEALLRYRQAKYRECLYLLDILLRHNPDDVNAAFYSGMCHYHLGRYQASSRFFETCMSHRNNAFAPEAEYYAALSHMAGGDVERGRKMLLDIAGENGHYAARAREILNGKK